MRSCYFISGRLRQSIGGFTLIELLIAVAVVGILTLLAYPAYTSYVQRGHRAQAQAYLMDLAQHEQQYLTDNRAYALDGATTAAAQLNDFPPSGVTPYYSFSVVARNATALPSFLITATSIGSQTPDGNLTLDETGNKTATNPAVSW